MEGLLKYNSQVISLGTTHIEWKKAALSCRKVFKKWNVHFCEWIAEVLKLCNLWAQKCCAALWKMWK